MTLGQFLRDARAARRMTLRGLARAMGVSAPFLSDVEHGRRTLSPERMAQAATALGVDVADVQRHGGLTPGLVHWIRSRPDIIELLHEARVSGAPLILVDGDRRRERKE